MNNKVVNKDATVQRESFTELLRQLANNSSALVHDEIVLVLQEIWEKVRAVRGGVLTVATGVAICFVAFMSLCAALIIELASYMPLVIAALVSGVGLALIGVVIASIGYRQLKRKIQKNEDNASTEKEVKEWL